MADGNAGFSIPGVYQPNILERVGAILQGQQDPIHKAQALDIEQKMGMMRLQQGQQELGLKKEEGNRKRINDLLDFVTKFDVPEEVATEMVRQVIKHDPAAQAYFKGINPDEISIAAKKKGIKIEREFGDNELPDPSRPGQFMPKGRYEVIGVPTKAGWKTIEGIKSVKEPKGPSVGPDREALAQEMGFPSFADAPTDKKTEINKEVKRREDERLKLQATQVNLQTGGQQFQQADTMRKEYLAQSKTFTNVRDSYKRVQASADNPSPAGDLSLIFAYMKMLDPQSVVRESEFRVAETARPLLERAGISWDRIGSVWEGKRLTNSQRNDFLNRANRLYEQQSESQNRLTSEFRRVASSQGVDPEKVIVDLGPSPTLKPSGKVKPKILSIERAD